MQENYKGGTFREMLFQYSKNRCQRDTRYRNEVGKMVRKRKQKQAAARKAAGQNEIKK